VVTVTKGLYGEAIGAGGGVPFAYYSQRARQSGASVGGMLQKSYRTPPIHLKKNKKGVTFWALSRLVYIWKQKSSFLII